MKHYVTFMGQPIDKCIRSHRGVQELLCRITSADQPSYGDILQFGYINRPKEYIVGGEGVVYKINCKGKTYILKAFNKCGKLSSEKKNSFINYCKEVQSFSNKAGCLPTIYDWAVINGNTKDNENLLVLMQYINGRSLYKLPGEFCAIEPDKIAGANLDKTEDYSKNKTIVRAKEIELCLQDYINQNYKLANISAVEVQRFLNACSLIFKLGVYSKLDIISKNIMLEGDRLYLIDPYWQETPYRCAYQKYDNNFDKFIIDSACRMLGPNNDLPNIVLRWLSSIDNSDLSSAEQKLLTDLQVEFDKSLIAAATHVLSSAMPMLSHKGQGAKWCIKDKLKTFVCTNNDNATQSIIDQLGLEM